MNDFLKQIHSIFCRSAVPRNVSTTLVDQLGSYQRESFCIFLSEKNA